MPILLNGCASRYRKIALGQKRYYKYGKTTKYPRCTWNLQEPAMSVIGYSMNDMGNDTEDFGCSVWIRGCSDV